jgi:FtsP/CotA-like multicopper oxidase with cupredoxin domain
MFAKITIENKILDPEEGTSFHWHGILHKDTPWFDGVPSGESYIQVPEPCNTEVVSSPSMSDCA